MRPALDVTECFPLAHRRYLRVSDVKMSNEPALVGGMPPSRSMYWLAMLPVASLQRALKHALPDLTLPTVLW